MRKILIHNFPANINKNQFDIQFNCTKCGKKNCAHIKIVSGFQKYDPLIRKKQIINDILNAILLNDKIVIFSSDLHYFLEYFSLKELHYLFSNDFVEVIYSDFADNVVGGEINNLVLNNSYYENKEKFIGSVEKKLIKKTNLSKLNQSSRDILLRLELNPLKIDRTFLEEALKKENNYDLKNNNFVSLKKIKTKNVDKVKFNEAIDLLSLSHTNRALILSSNFNINNVLLDSDSKIILNTKFAPTSRKTYQKNQIEVFKNLSNLKQIPNLGELYLNRIITLEDVIKIRNNIDGKIFRVWFESKDYDYNETLKHLLNSSESGMKAAILKHIRWVIPVIAGMANPVAGIGSSYANNFLINKLLNGWNPNLFLDKRLRIQVEEKVKEHKQKTVNYAISKKGSKIGRNDKCPCGSGKKYKRCCIYK